MAHVSTLLMIRVLVCWLFGSDVMAWLVGVREELIQDGNYPAVLDQSTDKSLKIPNVTKSNFKTYGTENIFGAGSGSGGGPVVRTFS